MMIPELLNQNQQFSEIIELCKKIYQDGNSVQIFKWRCIRLSNRVNSIKHATTTRYYNSGVTRDQKLASYQLLLFTCLEDVHEHVKRYLVKDEKLSRLLLKDGTGEEDFVKLNERLMHCVDELQLPLNVNEIFNPSDDTEDFLRDIEGIKPNIKSLIVLRDKQETDKGIDQYFHLVEQQKKERDSYKSKRLPNAKINIDLVDLKFDKIVGKGGFGTVWRGRFKREVVAIKKLQNLTDPNAIEDFRQEANIMRRISHQRTVNCFGICESPEMFCMILEYCEEGSLISFINKRKSSESNWELRKSIAQDIVVGMRYLHRLRIVHRDLKSANVLLDKKFGAKIADFGLSILKNTSVSVIKMGEEGTPQYMAPECFGIAPSYSSKSDVFAFSIILWELSHWKMAYNGVHRAEVKDSISRLGIRLDISQKIPTIIADLIRMCWDQSPNYRPTFNSISDTLEYFNPDGSFDYQDGNLPTDAETEQLSNSHFSAKVNPEKLNILLSPQLAIATNFDSPKISSTQAPQEVENIVNPEIQRFWKNITADAAQLSWDHFFDHVSLYLDLDDPNDLYLIVLPRDTEKLRQKIDPRSVLEVPTLSRLNQIVQDKKLKLFFGRFVREPTIHGRNKSFSDAPKVTKSDVNLAKNRRSNSTSQTDLSSPSNVIPFPSTPVKRSKTSSPLRKAMQNSKADEIDNRKGSPFESVNSNDQTTVVNSGGQTTVVKPANQVRQVQAVSNAKNSYSVEMPMGLTPKPYDFSRPDKNSDEKLARTRSNAGSVKLKSKFSIKKSELGSTDNEQSQSSTLDTVNGSKFTISKSMDVVKRGDSIKRPLTSNSLHSIESERSTDIPRPPVDEEKWRELQPVLVSKTTVSKSNQTLSSKPTTSRTSPALTSKLTISKANSTLTSKPTISKSPASLTSLSSPQVNNLVSKPTVSKSPASISAVGDKNGAVSLKSKPTVSKSPASTTAIDDSNNFVLKSKPTISKSPASTAAISDNNGSAPLKSKPTISKSPASTATISDNNGSALLKSKPTISKSVPAVPSGSDTIAKPGPPPQLASKPTKSKSAAAEEVTGRSNTPPAPAKKPTISKSINPVILNTDNITKADPSSLTSKPTKSASSIAALKSEMEKPKPVVKSENSITSDPSQSKPVVTTIDSPVQKSRPQLETLNRNTRFGTLNRGTSESVLPQRTKSDSLSKSKSEMKIDRVSTKSSKTSIKRGISLEEIKKRSSSAVNVNGPRSPFDTRRKSGDSLALSLEVVVEVDKPTPVPSSTVAKSVSIPAIATVPPKRAEVRPAATVKPAETVKPTIANKTKSQKVGKEGKPNNYGVLLAKILLAILLVGLAVVLILIFAVKI